MAEMGGEALLLVWRAGIPRWLYRDVGVANDEPDRPGGNARAAVFGRAPVGDTARSPRPANRAGAQHTPGDGIVEW